MAKARPGRLKAAFMALLTLCLVAGTAGAGWWMLHQEGASGSPGPSATRSYQADASGDTLPSTLLQPGRDYYVHVKLIEFSATEADGGAWDRGGDSAPDIAYRLEWNGTMLYEAPARDDRLIAEWDLLRLDLKEALLSGQVDLASAINAPLVRSEEGGVLTIEIWDDDVSFDDEAGRFDFPMSTLKEGVNTIRIDENGVMRLVIDLVPRDLSLPDLLERASLR